jgi:thiamine pyrophosphate-dependent acetolactate synthase large subunit-like protein
MERITSSSPALLICFRSSMSPVARPSRGEGLPTSVFLSMCKRSRSPMMIEFPPPDAVRAAADLLNAGRRTALLVGQGALGATAEVEAVAARRAAPVVKAFLGKTVIADTSPYSTGGVGEFGTIASSAAMQGCDTLLIAGSTMPWLHYYPKPGQARIVQIDRDPTSVGLRVAVDVPIVGDVRRTLTELLACGLPFVIAAQFAFPNRQCVAFVGDGGFTMLMGEFATAVKYELPIKVVVLKNNHYSRIVSENNALGIPPFATELQPIDFVRFAEACGGVGFACARPEEVRPALEAAWQIADRPALVEATIDNDADVSPPETYFASSKGG